jgi:C-terminal processing protease CtpA/Prc
MDFSGGDATPANFQGYGRGPLIGVGTAGAGGSVEEHQHRMLVALPLRLTASLMVRPGGRSVENYRVLPDVDFTTTAQDYRDGHATFLTRLLAKVGL